jgi:hypothetical protein
MKMKEIALVIALLAATSCATKREGVYLVDYTRKLDATTQAKVLTTRDDTVFTIEHDGRPIAKMSFCSNEGCCQSLQDDNGTPARRSIGFL